MIVHFLYRMFLLMIVQVTHPGFWTVKGTPSVAAVVASVDNKFGQFPASLRIQESKKEVGVLPPTSRNAD